MSKREPWHGTRTGYVQFVCRCDDCVVANRVYQRDYLRKRVSRGLVDSHGRKLR